MKKTCKVLLVVAIIVCCLMGIALNAQAATTVVSGNWGEDITWSVDSDSVLTVSGTGAIPDYLLGYSPFYNSYGIKSIVIEKGITSIGASVFAGCWDLMSVSFPSTLESINAAAFLYCTKLETVTIQRNVKTIGDMAFYGCTGITEFKVNSNNKYFSASAGVLFNKAKTTLIQVPGTKSGSYAVPSSVKTIKDYAFGSCPEITSLTISKNVTKIGTSAFLGNTSLKKITVVSSNTKYSSDSSGVLYNKSKTTLIQAPAKLTGKYTVPSGVKTIGSAAFYNCTGMTAITLPSTLTTIKDYAFEGCTGIEELVLPKKVKTIGYGAFVGCEKVKTVVFKGSAPSIDKTAFTDVEATVYYPYANSTWTAKMRKDYGGDLTWLKDNTLEITGQPSSESVRVGEKVSFGVGVTGRELTYQWQYRESSSDNWTNCSGSTAKSNRMEFSAKAKHHDRQYRCKVTNAAGVTAYTKTVKLYIFRIVAQPKDCYAGVGETFTLSVKATGKNLAYQWQYKNFENRWIDIRTADAQKATCTLIAGVSDHKVEYRCVITDRLSYKSMYSDVAELTLFAISEPLHNAYGSNGSNVKITVHATGAGLQYQWYVKDANGDKYVKSSVKTSTYSCKMTSKSNGRYVRCKVTDKYGNSLWSNEVTLNMRDLTIKRQPESKTAKLGSTAQFEVNCSNTNVQYQWQYRTSATDSWKNASARGNKKDSLYVSASAAKHGYQYRCCISDNAGNKIYTEVVTLSVIGFKAQPESGFAVFEEKTAKLKVKAVGNNLKYQWQYRKNDFGSWKNAEATGCKTNTLSFQATASRGGMYYRCKITDNKGNTAYTNTIYLSVVNIKSQPYDVTVYAGGLASFYFYTSVTPGSKVSYQWQYRTSSSGSWKNVSVNQNDNFFRIDSAKKHQNGYQYRCKITDTSGNVVYTKAATLTVG